jgi:hypothetical protein
VPKSRRLESPALNRSDRSGVYIFAYATVKANVAHLASLIQEDLSDLGPAKPSYVESGKIWRDVKHLSRRGGVATDAAGSGRVDMTVRRRACSDRRFARLRLPIAPDTECRHQ